MYSFYYFGATEFTVAKIPIHCSLAIKNLRTESPLLILKKKINLYFHIHFISIPFFFSIHVISVKYTLISNYYKNRRRLKQTLKNAQTRESLRCSHKPGSF